MARNPLDDWHPEEIAPLRARVAREDATGKPLSNQDRLVREYLARWDQEHRGIAPTPQAPATSQAPDLPRSRGRGLSMYTRSVPPEPPVEGMPDWPDDPQAGERIASQEEMATRANQRDLSRRQQGIASRAQQVIAEDPRASDFHDATRKYELTLVRNYEKVKGAPLSFEDKARLLDFVDTALKTAEETRTPQQTAVLRATQQSRVYEATVNSLGPRNLHKIHNALNDRQSQDPLRRVAEWDQEARDKMNPSFQDDQGNPIPPGRGRMQSMSRAERESLDRLSASRAGDEAYLRLAPEPQAPRARTRSRNIPEDPNISSQYPTWDMPGQDVQPWTVRAQANAGDQEINMVHDPLLEPRGRVTENNPADARMASPKGGIAAAMSDEKTSPTHGFLHREADIAARQRIYRSPSVTSFLTDQAGGNPTTWDDLSRNQQLVYERSPRGPFWKAVNEERQIGHETRGPRGMRDRGLGDFTDETKDFNTRGDIPSPQAGTFADPAGTPGTAGFRASIARSGARASVALEDLPGQVEHWRQEIRKAIEADDEAGAIKALEKHDEVLRHLENTQDLQSLQPDEPSRAINDSMPESRYHGSAQDDLDVQRAMDREFMGTVTNQSQFRGEHSSGPSMMRPAGAPLSSQQESLGNLSNMLDPQSGTKGPWIDKSLDDLGNPGSTYPRMRGSPIGMNLPDNFDLTPEQEAWDITNEHTRPLAQARTEASAGHTRDINGLPPDFQMEQAPVPHGMQDLLDLPDAPHAPVNPAFAGPMGLPGVPTPPVPEPLQSEPMLRDGVPYGPRPRPLDFHATRGVNGPFDSLLANLQRGRTATGEILGNLAPIAGKGLTAFGLAGDILQAKDTGDFFDYIQKNGLGNDETALTLGGLSQLPVLGPLIFNPRRFMEDETYRNKYIRPPQLA
jgi:hypothetical protein